MKSLPIKSRERSGATVGNNTSLINENDISNNDILGYKPLPLQTNNSNTNNKTATVNKNTGNKANNQKPTARGSMNQQVNDDDDDDDDDTKSDDDNSAPSSHRSNMRNQPNKGSTSSNSTGSMLGNNASSTRPTGLTNDHPSSSPGLIGIPPGNKPLYNPKDYANLKVSDDIRELFTYITNYTPHTVELDTRLRPFIPEYIPAIGDVDPFLKPSRPDDKEEILGIKYLDEPGPIQSDPTVLNLQLRSLSKKSGLDPISVRAIEHAQKNPKEITKWIQSISDLHRSKPPPSVHYTKAMPDIEILMQEWPEQFEQLLKDIALPGADIAMTLEEYTKVICGVCDIPVYNNLVQSLHVLFTLYYEFRSNVHFQALQGSSSSNINNNGPPGGGGSMNNSFDKQRMFNTNGGRLIGDEDEEEERKMG